MMKPVAHRFKWEEQEEWQYGDGYDATGAPNDPDYFAYEPLYTQRDLTDEEINQIVWQQNLLLGNDDLRKFARAILRKASEK